MLTDLHMYATLPATDLERARRFYAEKLGLTPESELPGGVVFEEHESPSLKTINSIATIGPNKGAWFKDSEGNLLSLAQFEEA